MKMRRLAASDYESTDGRVRIRRETHGAEIYPWIVLVDGERLPGEYPSKDAAKATAEREIARLDGAACSTAETDHDD